MKHHTCLSLFFFCLLSLNCSKETPSEWQANESEWNRSLQNPVFRDLIPDENYQVASDPHVFLDEKGHLKMIYSGDVNGISSIKLASGISWTDWEEDADLLTEVGPSGLDISKETSFYYKVPNGKHQIYYIGYPEENDYQSEIYLAEADLLEGPYVQSTQPVIPRGEIAGKDVYCMTSPSINEHERKLYMSFIGWNASPNNVTEVWVLGATSEDNGKTWSEFKEVDTRIGMEGQVSKTPDGTFTAVRTGDYNRSEAIFISKAEHPFGPWQENKEPIIIKQGFENEMDEVIAPQIVFDPATNRRILYYTGANHEKGWWIMMATED